MVSIRNGARKTESPLRGESARGGAGAAQPGAGGCSALQSPSHDLSFVTTGRRAWTTTKSGQTAPWRDTTASAPPSIAPSG